MAKLIWTVLCERAVVDAGTNALTLNNTIEEIYVPKPSPESFKEAAGRPLAARGNFSFVTNWEREKRDRTDKPLDFLVRLFDPDGGKCLEGRQLLGFGNSKRGRAIANLEALPITAAGRYLWKIYLPSGKDKWKPVGELPYTLKFLDSEAELKRLTKTAQKTAANMYKKPRK